MTQIVAVIPARMGSSRFPGKPLAPLVGRPMIEHVVRRVEKCAALNSVHVATCDEEIRRVVEGFGGKVIMTSPRHERASDRVAEAVEILEASGQSQPEIVVMIQGDEPMIRPEMIDASLEPMLQDSSVRCVNLAHRIVNQQEYLDPNTIKLTMNVRGDALCFSRSPIAATDLTGGFDSHGPVFKQVCVIPFRRDFLREFSRLRPTPLEQIESIDMLRVLEHGGRVRLVESRFQTQAVDTPDDLRIVEALMKRERFVF